MNLTVIVTAGLVIYTAAVGYIGYMIGEEHTRMEAECTCYTCKNNESCVVHEISNCDWCDQWEDE